MVDKTVTFLISVAVVVGICFGEEDRTANTSEEPQERTLGHLVPALGSIAHNIGHLLAGPAYDHIHEPVVAPPGFGFGGLGYYQGGGYLGEPAYYQGGYPGLGGYHRPGFVGYPAGYNPYHNFFRR